MKVFVVEHTELYGGEYRTGIRGVYSSLEIAKQALIDDGAVLIDGYRIWQYPEYDNATARIFEYQVDPTGFQRPVLR